MVCFYVGRDQKIFVSPENYGDWRSARSRSSVLSGNYRGDRGPTGEGPKSFSSPENYGDWRSARSRSSVLSGNYRGDLCGNQPVCRVAQSSGEKAVKQLEKIDLAS